jgi:hypothetical protein
MAYRGLSAGSMDETNDTGAVKRKTAIPVYCKGSPFCFEFAACSRHQTCSAHCQCSQRKKLKSAHSNKPNSVATASANSNSSAIDTMDTSPSEESSNEHAVDDLGDHKSVPSASPTYEQRVVLSLPRSAKFCVIDTAHRFLILEDAGQWFHLCVNLTTFLE